MELDFPAENPAIKELKTFKIRCHALSDIMAGSIGLTEIQSAKLSELSDRKNGIGKPLTPNMEKELADLIQKRDNPELPAGAKTYVKKWLKQALYRRDEKWKSIVVDKGLMTEKDAIDLTAKRYGLTGIDKNDEYFSNDYLEGFPDVVYQLTEQEKAVRDNKSSWDLFTFPMFEDEIPDKGYEWQLQGYMILVGCEKAFLDYVLIDTPKALVDMDLKKLYFQSGGKAEDWTPDLYESLQINYKFEDIPVERRVKTFEIKRDHSLPNRIKERVLMCREYVKKLLEQ